MAIAFRAESHITPANGVNATVTEPSGTASGDQLFSLHVVDSPGGTPGLPAGWTQLFAATSVNTHFRLKVGRIQRGGSAPSYAHTNTNAYRELFVVGFSGVDPTTPVEVTTTPITTNSTTVKPDPPGLTTLSNGSVVLVFYVMWSGGPVSGGWTVSTSYISGSGAAGAAGFIEYRTITTAGAEDPGAIGGTPQGGDDGWVVTVALKPASGATTETPGVGIATAAGVAPSVSTVRTPTQGVATAAGTNASAGTSALPGTATATGTSPAAASSATPTPGAAVVAGSAPALFVNATPAPSAATALGVAPTDSVQDTTETPTPGVAVAAGLAPAASSALASTSGSATASGVTATASTIATPATGSGTAAGVALSVSARSTPPPGVTVTASMAPAGRITITPARGIVTVHGFAPGSGTLVQRVGLNEPRTASFVTVGATTASFEAPSGMAALERPVTTAGFERPAVSASFEQAEAEIVFD